MLGEKPQTSYLVVYCIITSVPVEPSHISTIISPVAKVVANLIDF